MPAQPLLPAEGQLVGCCSGLQNNFPLPSGAGGILPFPFQEQLDCGLARGEGSWCPARSAGGGAQAVVPQGQE